MKPLKLLVVATTISLLGSQAALAQNTFDSRDNLSEQMSFVKESSKAIATNTEKDTQAEKELEKPSFWWATEQFDPFGGRLVENWLTDSKLQQIDLVVNWQLWTVLDYLGRYSFVNQFGTVARKYGYELNIFNQKSQLLATYKYNSLSSPPKWEINFEQWGNDSLQIETSSN